MQLEEIRQRELDAVKAAAGAQYRKCNRETAFRYRVQAEAARMRLEEVRRLEDLGDADA